MGEARPTCHKPAAPGAIHQVEGDKEERDTLAQASYLNLGHKEGFRVWVSKMEMAMGST